MTAPVVSTGRIFVSEIKGRLFHSTGFKNVNCNRTSVAKIGRLTYTRLYPVIVVNSDGSTIRTRYCEPRKIIKLPVDLNLLTAEQKAMMISSRKPKEKLIMSDELQVDFDPYAYINK